MKINFYTLYIYQIKVPTCKYNEESPELCRMNGYHRSNQKSASSFLRYPKDKRLFVPVVRLVLQTEASPED